MTNTKQIITRFENRQEFLNLLKYNNGIIVVKFGAGWCQPCKVIAPIVHDFFASTPSEVMCADIDVDESFDLFAFLKSKKMINGIPAIFCYKKGNESFIPDDSVSGADITKLNEFFTRCNMHLQNAKKITK